MHASLAYNAQSPTNQMAIKCIINIGKVCSITLTQYIASTMLTLRQLVRRLNYVMKQ